MGAGKNPFNDFSTGYGDLGMGGSVPRADSRPANAWDATEEVSLGDTNGKADWNRTSSSKTPSSDKDIKKREKELNKREKELAKKEEELRRREQAVQEAGGAVVKQVKNWPPCYPIIHHDIPADIPDQFTRAVRGAWIAFWGFFWASTWNMISAIVALCTISGPNKPGGLAAGMALSVIYLVAGVPGTYLLWYKPLYRGAQNDKAFGFAAFFLSTMALMVFIIWSAVGPDLLVSQFSHTGVLSTISCFDNSTVAGIFYLIGTVFWILQALLVLVVLKMVYSRFRGRSSNASTMKQEMVETLSRRNIP